MTVHNLDHINLSVRDFEETVEWYRRVFGFELVEEGVQEGTRWGVIRTGRAMLCIYEHADFEFVDKDTRHERKVHGLSHFGLRMTEREEWEKTVEREQIKVGYGGPVRWPHSTAFYIYDPTGYEIEVAFWDGDEVAFG